MIAIRRLDSDDCIDELTRLLHRAYAPLAAVGLNYTACDQSEEVTKRRVDRGECYVAAVGRRLVGTVTLYQPDDQIACHWYKKQDVAQFGQFAVEPAEQGKGIGSRLLSHVEDRARALGFSELALDTAEDATHLLTFYQARGYRIVDRVRWAGKTYESLIMSCKLY